GTLRRRRFDRVQVVGAARVALLLGEVVEERQLVSLEQLHLRLEVRRLEERAVGVQTAVDRVDRLCERERAVLERLAISARLVEAEDADVDGLAADAAPDPRTA